MILGRFSTRKVLLLCVSGLISTIAGGGVLLSFVEHAGIFDGVWMAFNIVSTTGYGAGPETAAGQLFSMAMFVAGAGCWFGVVVVAIETASMRFRRYGLIDEALRPLGGRPRNRLFHVN